jgi:hypothetical protein
MKFTALVREVATRDIRVTVEAKSQDHARRLTQDLARDPVRYKNGIIARQKFVVTSLDSSIEPLTRDTILRIQKEHRS